MRLPVGSPAGLDPGDVIRLHTLPALGRLVAHLGALLEGLEPGALYTVVVNEEILTPVVRGDEAVALLVAEPLHRSLGHFWDPPFVSWGPAPTKKPPLIFRAALPSKTKPTFYYPRSIPQIWSGTP